MTDAIRELFELLAKKENTGSDYTGTVTRVEGNTAYVRFNGSDIDDTPVSLSIGAKEDDTVRVRVADGRAWLVGNDTAPPNDSSGVAYDLIRTNAYIRELTTENIRGENGWINLLNGTFDYGNGALSWNGDHLTVKGAITATSGKIGPWDIGATAIYKGSSTWGASTSGAAYFGDNGISITDKFKVDAAGALTATGANITGVITATSGALGAWTLTDHSFYATANNAATGNVERLTGMQVPGTGAIALAVGATSMASWATAPFYVTHAGVMYATGATISGTLTAGENSKIGPWTVTTNSIYYGNSAYGNASGLYFGTSGLSLGSAFKVSAAGALTCTGANISGTITSTNATITGTITANAGNIGGFTVVNEANTGTTSAGGHCYTRSLYAHCSDNTYEYEVGMKGDSGSPGYLAFYVGRIAKGAAWSTNTKVFSVANNGKLTATNADISGKITATEGKIGPWYIRSGGISVENNDNFTASSLQSSQLLLSTTSRYTQVSSSGVITAGTSATSVQATMNQTGFSLGGGTLDSVRFGHGTGSSQNVGIYDNTVGGWILAHGSTNHTTVLPYYSSSDIRVKTDIKETQVKALDILKRISIVEFKKFGEYQPIGMIADWMEELDPRFTGGGGYDEDGNMVIKYIDMFYLQGYLIKAIQELADKVSRMGG